MGRGRWVGISFNINFTAATVIIIIIVVNNIITVVVFISINVTVINTYTSITRYVLLLPGFVRNSDTHQHHQCDTVAVKFAM